jgi:hypothetical protein
LAIWLKSNLYFLGKGDTFREARFPDPTDPTDPTDPPDQFDGKGGTF